MLQRVHRGSVTVDGDVVGRIGPGVVALVAVTHSDTDADVSTTARKIAQLRILADDTSLSEHVDDPEPPAVLVISQFTLYGTTTKGRRPSWSDAAPRPLAQPLVDAVAEDLRARGIEVATGIFGAQMDVELINDGPFTLIVDTQA